MKGNAMAVQFKLSVDTPQEPRAGVQTVWDLIRVCYVVWD